MLLIYLKNVPAPILIGLVAGDVVEVPQALDGLRPEQVVSVVGLDVEVDRRIRRRVEVADLGREVGRLPRERQVARVGELLGEFQQEILVLEEINTHFRNGLFR